MTELAPSELDRVAVNTLRLLAVDMVERAHSGHPGAPMGQAELAYWLWTRHLRHNPAQPQWWNRDRFVLSCGHASALLYSLLHLCGYGLTMKDLRNFRQLHSRTPGHPEYGLAPGVEITSGPLGQGTANAVGMAMAERLLAEQFNRDGHRVVDHRIWVMAGDGDLMEGVASEASSLAGHLALGKLKVLYDANRITIDGTTDLTFTEDVRQRYEAYGWYTLEVADGHDLAAIDAALEAAKAETARPTLVLVRTHIGFGSPNKQDSEKAHGSPLGAEEVKATKRRLGWPEDAEFLVPEEVGPIFARVRERGAELEADWKRRFEAYRDAHPQVAEEFERRLRGAAPDGWEEGLPSFQPGDQIATRKVSGMVLNAVADRRPELIGGSADLAGSDNTYLADHRAFSAAAPGRNVHYGVREHAMGAVLNGLALSRMLRPYGGTFLVFSDYMRPAIRLAAMMGLPVVYVFTHDSVFVGEDGPTHQPISQLASLRAIPGLAVIRPADANETVAAWRAALANRGGPTALVLTRQKLPVLEETAAGAEEGVVRGAYVVADPPDGEAQALLLAAGSEVAVVLEAHRRLLAEGIATRVVSMPCWSWFEAQDGEYRDRILPPHLDRRLAVEAGTPMGWHRWTGAAGDVLAIDRFGLSAPCQDLEPELGFTAENVAARLKSLL